MWNTQRDGRGGHCRCPISVWSPYLPTMWAAIFGPAEPETPRKKTPEEIAAQKEARKKKAAEARKKREALKRSRQQEGVLISLSISPLLAILNGHQILQSTRMFPANQQRHLTCPLFPRMLWCMALRRASVKAPLRRPN